MRKVTMRIRDRATPAGTRAGSRCGSALIVVLWSVVLLSMGAVSLLYGTRVGTKIEKNFGDRTQARFLALAGIEKAKAVLYREAERRKLSGEPFSTVPYDSPADFREQKLGTGTYQVLRAPRHGESGTIVFGILDEERRLDVNRVTAAELMKLPDFAPDAAAAIQDWRDRDGKVTPQGAERDYYAKLGRPYRIRNGPIETFRELLAVKGVMPGTLLGEDLNANGILDPEENDGERTPPSDDEDGALFGGWSAHLALATGTDNLTARGEERVNIQSGTEEELAAVEGMPEGIAAAIVKYRNIKSYSAITELLDVKNVEQNPNANRNRNRNRNNSNRNRNNRNSNNSNNRNNEWRAVGSTLIDESTLAEIADGVTARPRRLENALNINTAAPTVLECLPGMTEDLARAVVDYRESNGFFKNIAELLQVSGINKAKLKQLAPRVCVRSGTFRILAEGTIKSTGARQRIEVIVQFANSEFKTLAYREDV